MPDREDKRIILLNRRLVWKMGRTIKTGVGPKDFEFIRLDAGEEADIPDGVSTAEAYLALIRDVVEQISTAEKAIRGGKDLIGELAKLSEFAVMKAKITHFDIDEEIEDDGEIFEPWKGISE